MYGSYLHVYTNNQQITTRYKKKKKKKKGCLEFHPYYIIIVPVTTINGSCSNSPSTMLGMDRSLSMLEKRMSSLLMKSE